MTPFSDEKLINPVKKNLEKSLSILKCNGRGLEFLGVKNGVVCVHLIGVCKGCALSSITLKHSLERQLKMGIHPEISIINLEGGE